jgi:hypothetical protein
MKFHKTKNIIRLILLSTFVILLLSCGKEVSTSPVEPPPPEGFIYVNSIPTGFTIFQDGRNTGRFTPDSISYIDAGSYEITLKKKYFKDTSVVVTINEDEKVSLTVDLLTNPSMYGSLNLQSIPPGAEITINDSTLTQVTPLLLSGLLPGEYNIKFKLFNHRDIDILGIVQSSTVTRYTEELRDTSEWVDYQISNSDIQSNSLTSIVIDLNNNKWIGTLNNGLIRYDEINFVNYLSSNSSIPSNNVLCLAVDIQNRIWVGTNQGIGIFDGTNWTVYNNTNTPLTSNIINTIKFDNIGNAWIGTSGNLVKFDGGSWTIFNESLTRDWIKDLWIESDNKIWLGTRLDGIFIFENEIYSEFSKIEYGYPTYTVSSVAPDQSGNLWFCFLPDTSGRGGVSYWDGNVFTNLFLGSFSNNINHIFIDQANNKWISTSEGFVRINSVNVTELFNTVNSLISGNLITSSMRDNSGAVWITTSGGGLNKYKPTR